MIVVHATVNHSHHHILASVAQVPHLVGAYLEDIRCNLSHVGSRLRVFVFGSHFSLHVESNHLDVGARCEVIDGPLGSVETYRIGNPKHLRLAHHGITFHLVKHMAQVALSDFSKLL